MSFRIMVNNCVVQGYIVGTAKQNVTLHGFPKERARRQLCWRRFVSSRLKATESGRVTPICAVHASFLLTLLTMSNTMGFKETSRQQDCCTSQPFYHQNTRCTTLTQSVAGRSGLAEPGSEWRTPQLSQTPSK